MPLYEGDVRVVLKLNLALLPEVVGSCSSIDLAALPTGAGGAARSCVVPSSCGAPLIDMSDMSHRTTLLAGVSEKRWVMSPEGYLWQLVPPTDKFTCQSDWRNEMKISEG